MADGARAVIPFKRGNDNQGQHDSYATGELVLGAPNDTGNAKVFCQRHGNDVRYRVDMGRGVQKGWLRWSEHRFDDATWDDMKHMMIGVLEECYVATQAISHPLAGWYEQSLNNGRIEAALKIVATRPGIKCKSAHFDADTLLLGVANGVLDLRGSVGFRAGLRSDMITKAIPTPYYPHATCRTWIGFLKSTYQDDETVIDWMQQWLGYCLTGLVHEELMVLLHGYGSNGKSVLLNTVAHVMGELAGQMPLGAFDQRNIKVQHLFVAECRAKRVMLASEVSKRAEFNEQLVKSLASKDKQKGRRYYENYDPAARVGTTKVMFAVNHLPALSDFTESMERRLVIVPHRVTFPQDDGTLERDLQKEAPGILNWMIKGFQMWRESKSLKPLPDAFKVEATRYQDTHDTVGEFIETMCVVHVDKRVPRRKLYKKYLEWCATNGINGRLRLTPPEFFNDMRGRGFRDSSAGDRPFFGIGLR